MRHALLAVTFAALAVLIAGCNCESQCQSKYNDCVAKAPPGASRTDCTVTYDTCIQACQQKDQVACNEAR
jgi:hypothetical protein